MISEAAAVITSEQLRDARASLSRPPHEAEGLPGLFMDRHFSLWSRRRVPAQLVRGWRRVGDTEPGRCVIAKSARFATSAVIAMRPVDQPCNVNLIRCPWHSWSYDLKGALVKTPEIRGAEVHGLDSFDFGRARENGGA